MADDDESAFAGLRREVVRQVVLPDQLAKVRDLTASRQRWRKLANWAECSAQLVLILATGAAYAAGYYSDRSYLAFVAGCANVAVIALMRFSTYANHESAERTLILNRELEYLGVRPVPDITADAGGSAT